jgi:hypothetical protein
VLERLATRGLFHFTDERNLDRIRSAGGLLSIVAQREHGFECAFPGGNAWSHEADRRFGLDSYVHLCFFDAHPMEYCARKDGRITKSRFLRVDGRVLRQAGARITLGVSNERNMEILTVREALERLDIDAIVERLNWRDPDQLERVLSARKYEVLIPRKIPITLISGL